MTSPSPGDHRLAGQRTACPVADGEALPAPPLRSIVGDRAARRGVERGGLRVATIVGYSRFGGILATTTFTILFVPMFYVVSSSR